MPARTPLTTDQLARFTAIVGEKYALTAPEDQAAHLVERRGLYQGATPLVLKPGSTSEISRIMTLATELKQPVVPQGGNTGLVGGQIPFEQGSEIVLSLSRLDEIRSVDAVGNTLIAEAGVTLAAIQEQAELNNRLFPLSLASEGTCQIGGNLATNAGGMQVLAFGNARDLCLGLEVVLADGRIWNGLRTLRKDNTGYDMRDLFIGSEGTLGIITAASLKLFPKPAELATAFVGLAELDQVALFFLKTQETAANALTRFELMPRLGIDLVLRHAEGSRDPLDKPHPWYVLLEISGHSSDNRANQQMMHVLEAAMDEGTINDAAVATSAAQESEFWSLRERLSDVQGLEGGSIKNDIAVPVADVPGFIRTAGARIEKLVPGARPVPFGHFGDGNIHYNISQPVGMAKEEYLARWDDVTEAVNEVVLGFNGTVSAEHGIGRMKQHLMPKIKSPVELAMMRTIKQAFDPLGILNPGKIL
ncbi:MAG: FAD-binding oxidoreductase [Hyphomicrobiaceae bacterium]